MKRHSKAIAAISALLLLTCALGAMSAAAAAPLVSMGTISSVTFTSAHVTGNIDPEDSETFYSFEYATDPTAASWSGFNFEGTVPAGAGPTNVEADLNGLTPGTEYFVRLVGWNFVDSQVFSKPVVAFTTTPIAAPTVSIAAPTQLTDDGAHFEGAIDPGGSDPAFDFNWRFQCTPACPGLEGTVAADSSSHIVEADATGLKPGTVYAVRLLAANAGAEATAGPESFTTATRAPAVLASSASALDTEATLKGQVDPGGLATTYRFEYGPTSAYGQSTPAKTIPAGGDPVAVSANLFGLAPGAGYHFRLLAENAEGADESADGSFSTFAKEASPGSCPNEAIRIQQKATHLPDCRAYEQVSPADKNGADASPSVLRVSSDGRAITWHSLGAYAGVPGANADAEYAGHRSPSGWQTTGFAPSKVASPDVESGVFATLGGWSFSGNLSRMFFESAGSYDPADEDDGFIPATDVYMVDGSGHTTWISHGQGIAANAEFQNAGLVGSSEDGSSAFFTATEPMTPEVPNDGQRRLYRWRNGVVGAVGRDSSGALLPEGSTLGSGTSVVAGSSGDAGRLADSLAVSSDGSAFLYRTVLNEDLLRQGRSLFLHEDGVGNIQISVSQRAGSEGQPASDALLLSASPELRKVYFWSPDQLTEDAPVGGGDYVYDRSSGTLAFTNPDRSFEEGTGARTGLVGASGDIPYIYFVSDQALTPGASAGSRNLYVRHAEDVGLVAVLGESEPGLTVLALGNQTPYPERTSSAISADGSQLVFQAEVSLAGNESGGRSQVYSYDAARGELRCVSCTPSGSHTLGDSRLKIAAETRPFTPRAISEDGSLIAFTSTAPLSPGDTNGVADVYEYSGGRLHRLTDGVSGFPSEFAGMSPDGDDIYVFTRASLAPSDIDNGSNDVYDVRRGGGFLMSAPAPGCEGEPCRDSSGGSSTPTAIAIATEHSGQGNPNPVRARKKHRHKKRAHHRKVRRASHSGHSGKRRHR